MAGVTDLLVVVLGGVILGVSGFVARSVWKRFEARTTDRSLKDLVGRDLGSDGLAVRVLRKCNAEAADLYRRKLRAEAPTSSQEALWGLTFDETDWAGQRRFVNPPVPGVSAGSTATDLMREALLKLKHRGQRRFWIEGVPGAGKSTLLARLFFELVGGLDPETKSVTKPAAMPVPMFVQPRNVTKRALTGNPPTPDNRGWLHTFFATWLDNRGISNISSPRMLSLAADLGRAMQSGQVIMLLDGYDELAALDPMAKQLLEVPLVVAASRRDPDRQTSMTVLRLEDHWSPELCRSYLEKQWGSTPFSVSVGPLVARLAEPHASWLRNPRYLSFLVQALESHGSALTEQDVAHATHNEFDLLHRAFTRALVRLGTIPGAADDATVTSGLARIAVAQFASAMGSAGDDGTPLAGAKAARGLEVPVASVDTLWRSVGLMTEIVTSSTTELGTTRFSLSDERWLEYFLGQAVCSEIVQGQVDLPTVHRQWPRITLATTAALLEAAMRTPQAAVERVFGLLEGGTIARSSLAAKARNAMTLNLLDLAVKLQVEAADDPAYGREARTATGQVVTRFGRLDGLDMSHASLSCLSFADCRFDGSSLAGADLSRSEFTRCTFRGADLTGADASQAAFRDCTFQAEDRPLNVARMEIAGASWLGTTDVTRDQLAGAGAETQRTRYRGPFGRIFSEHQDWLLGGDYNDLERKYVEAIRGHVRRSGNGPVYLIDLMAGGASGRWRDLMLDGQRGRSFPNLHVLAVDRDVRQLAELSQSLGGRFQTLKVDLGREGDQPDGSGVLGSAVSERLRLLGWPEQADLIIGKKALHELPRGIQGALISECGRALREDGQLILFTDSPGIVSEAGQDILARVRALARERECSRSQSSAGRTLEEVLFSLEFGDQEDDVGLFCNLWVVLKDWANDNHHEFANRYFAGPQEIMDWCAYAGLYPTDGSASGNYRITTAKFNEDGLREALDYLSSPAAAGQPDMTRVEEILKGTDDERFGLVDDFTYRALQQANGNPTKLGAVLDARPEVSRFDDIGDLHDVENPDLAKHLKSITIKDLTFDFPVHVLVFRKTGGPPPSVSPRVD